MSYSFRDLLSKALQAILTREGDRFSFVRTQLFESPGLNRQPHTKSKNVRACGPSRRGNKQFNTFMAKLNYITFMVNLYHINGWYYIYGFYYF